MILTLQISLAWNQIRGVRGAICKALKDFDENVRDASMMTGSELLENALKYGESVPNLENITFMLDANKEQIVIEVCNGATDLDKIKNLQQNIDKISQAIDKESLYIERLRELLLDSNSYGKLGLYRIAFEGKFDISCSYTEQILRVRASRGGIHE